MRVTTATVSSLAGLGLAGALAFGGAAQAVDHSSVTAARAAKSASFNLYTVDYKPRGGHARGTFKWTPGGPGHFTRGSYVEDLQADRHGAEFYLRYKNSNTGKWKTYRVAVDRYPNGNKVGLKGKWYSVKRPYVRVCLYKNADHSTYCSAYKRLR